MVLSLPKGLTLYFCRHGETEANVEKLFQGHTVDTPLTRRGHKQAKDIAKILKRCMGTSAKKVPTRQLPNFLVHLAALRDPAIKLILPELGKLKNASNEKARRMLGWAPRSNEESVVATAKSLVRLGLLNSSPNHAR